MAKAAPNDGIRVAGTPPGPFPVVLLGVDDTAGVLPIFVGFDEAASIARGLDATDLGRPLTHDLTLDVVEALGGRVDCVVVSAVEDGTYIADLHLESPREEVVVDARSDLDCGVRPCCKRQRVTGPGVFEEGQQDPDEFDDLDDIRDVMEL